MRFAFSELISHGWCVMAWLQEKTAVTPDGSQPAATAPPNAPAGPAAEGGSPNLLSVLLDPINLLLISGFLFVFLVLRPQQKQMKELQRSLEGLRKNDRVVTNSGIHGTVVQATAGEPTIVLRIDENSGARMTINREVISRVVDDEKSEGKKDD